MGLSAAPAPTVLPGLDVLRRDGLGSLPGRRIGLVTNHTGRTVDGVPALAVLSEELGLDVVALFSPEHGFDGTAAAGESVASTPGSSGDLPAYSLYGETRTPTPEMLSGVDVLVLDLQDAGVRFYTYASTMKLAMEAAAAAGVAFVVLDRPNPNGGLRVEGPVLEPEFVSFVGAAPVPLMHGMTLGELARLFRAAMPSGERVDLTVVPVEGLRRDMLWSDTGLTWPVPSPNLRTFDSALAYPATALLEGANVSEGRGTERSFELGGAPWLDGDALVEKLSAAAVDGARFSPTSFVPRSISAAPDPKYRDERCSGFLIHVEAPRRFRPVRTGLAILGAIRELAPERFLWVESEGRPWIDLLLGTDRVRKALSGGRSPDEILEAERPAVERFMETRGAYLLY